MKRAMHVFKKVIPLLMSAQAGGQREAGEREKDKDKEKDNTRQETKRGKNGARAKIPPHAGSPNLNEILKF